jgi:hypothetical protein
VLYVGAFICRVLPAGAHSKVPPRWGRREVVLGKERGGKGWGK